MNVAAATAWWWVRHAPVAGAPARIYGQLDVACETVDEQCYQLLASMLPPDAVRVATPLQRTTMTLAAITAAADWPQAAPIIEPAFAEQHFGNWQGLTWADMQAQDSRAYEVFWSDPTANAPPGGESFANLMVRTARAIEQLSARHRGRHILAVAHGGTIRAALALALGLTPAASMGVVIDNLSLTRLTLLPDGLLRSKGGVWRIDGVNIPCRWIQPPSSC